MERKIHRDRLERERIDIVWKFLYTSCGDSRTFFLKSYVMLQSIHRNIHLHHIFHLTRTYIPVIHLFYKCSLAQLQRLCMVVLSF